MSYSHLKGTLFYPAYMRSSSLYMAKYQLLRESWATFVRIMILERVSTVGMIFSTSLFAWPIGNLIAGHPPPPVPSDSPQNPTEYHATNHSPMCFSPAPIQRIFAAQLSYRNS